MYNVQNFSRILKVYSVETDKPKYIVFHSIYQLAC